MKKKIAIIGAGFSGLVLAQKLQPDFDVHVFEKARGVGGRMSSRFSDPFYFDHGVSEFAVKSKAFKRFLKPLIEKNIVSNWIGKNAIFYRNKKISEQTRAGYYFVGCPNMNSLCKYFSKNIVLNINTEVSPLLKEGDGWQILNKENDILGIYDIVISTAPPAQTIRLFDQYLPKKVTIHNAQMQACYALMMGFKRVWRQSWNTADVYNSSIEKISINSTKPQRDDTITAMVVYSSADWARKHIDEDAKIIESLLIKECELFECLNWGDAEYVATHLWRYAITNKAIKYKPYLDLELGLAALGDWCVGSCIEDVWFSTLNFASHIKRAYS